MYIYIYICIYYIYIYLYFFCIATFSLSPLIGKTPRGPKLQAPTRVDLRQRFGWKNSCRRPRAQPWPWEAPGIPRDPVILYKVSEAIVYIPKYTYIYTYVYIYMYIYIYVYIYMCVYMVYDN